MTPPTYRAHTPAMLRKIEGRGTAGTHLLSEVDLELAKPVSKSVRLNGRSTCIRLEAVYWRILELEARRQAVPVNKLLAILDLEVQKTQGTVLNFSSLVRVVAVVNALRAAGVSL